MMRQARQVRRKEQPASLRTVSTSLSHSESDAARHRRMNPRTGVEMLLDLQRTYGNAFVQRLVQRKLSVSQPGDKHEQEADRVAEAVVRMSDTSRSVPVIPRYPELGVHRMCSECDEKMQRQAMGPEPEEEEEQLQRQEMPDKEEDMQRQAVPEEEEQEEEKVLARQGPPEKKEEEVMGRKANVARQNEQESQDAVAPLVEAAITRKRGGGQPLERKTRAQMEPAFGADFGGVRVHGDAEADRLNRVLNARAFTVGTDIFFRHGEYSPDSAEGQKLLAHELTHALQQGDDQVRRTPAGIQRLCAECEAERQGLTAPPQQWQAKLTVSAPEDADEREADRVAQTVMGHLQRQGQEGEEQEQEEEDRRRMTAAKGGRGPRGRAGEEEEEEPPVQAKRTEVLLYRQAEEREQSGQEPPTKAGANALFRQVSGGLPSGEVVQRVPQPGRNFGTRSYCGFGITIRIPGFIQSHMQDNFDVDYTTG